MTLHGHGGRSKGKVLAQVSKDQRPGIKDNSKERKRLKKELALDGLTGIHASMLDRYIRFYLDLLKGFSTSSDSELSNNEESSDLSDYLNRKRRLGNASISKNKPSKENKLQEPAGNKLALNLSSEEEIKKTEQHSVTKKAHFLEVIFFLKKLLYSY